MASFTAPMKVDPLLKENFLALRDALASLTTEEAQAILEAARAQTTTPAPTAIEGHPVEAISNAVLPQPQPELDHLLNRPVPYGLVGLFSRVLDAAMDDPARVREALTKTCQWLF